MTDRISELIQIAQDSADKCDQSMWSDTVIESVAEQYAAEQVKAFYDSLCAKDDSGDDWNFNSHGTWAHMEWSRFCDEPADHDVVADGEFNELITYLGAG